MATTWGVCFAVIMVLVAARLEQEDVLDVSQGAPDWERLFMSIPNSQQAADHLRFYTSQPHVAGTPGDWETVLYTHDMLEELGFNVTIEPHEV